ncbi:uncharacterized protein LOC142033570 isoform X2 [Buteo buteo]|uniref:uncharacterized protein LOC142033570 isoform X2 n=1 Tax=Buteo buteo TaxID=30397 RepID=UPI003EB89CDF
MLSFALRVLVREGVKSKLLFRSSCFPERRKERLARKPSISNQSNLPVIICDQHQITPARHDPSSLRCNGPLYGCVYTGGGRGEKGRERKREKGERVWMCVRGGGRIIHRNGNRRLPRLSASGAGRASGAETCWAGAERGAWHTAPPPPPTDISLPSPAPRSSWASSTGVKLIINRVKLIKGLGARGGRSESSSPFPAAPHPPPRRQRPGSGDRPPPPNRGSSGAAQPEQEGKGRRGTGEGGRKAAAAAANPAGWLTGTESGRASGGGGGRRGLAPGLARLGAAGCVCACVCVCMCVCTKPGPGSCPRAVLGTTRPAFPPPPPPALPLPRSASATEGVGNRRGRGRASARLSLQPRGDQRRSLLTREAI